LRDSENAHQQTRTTRNIIITVGVSIIVCFFGLVTTLLVNYFTIQRDWVEQKIEASNCHTNKCTEEELYDNVEKKIKTLRNRK
jgi:hypothetical protein